MQCYHNDVFNTANNALINTLLCQLSLSGGPQYVDSTLFRDVHDASLRLGVLSYDELVKHFRKLSLGIWFSQESIHAGFR